MKGGSHGRLSNCFGEADGAVRNCNHDCNYRMITGETQRYKASLEISHLGPGDTPRYSLLWIQVLVLAREWRFKSSHPHHQDYKHVSILRELLALLDATVTVLVTIQI